MLRPMTGRQFDVYEFIRCFRVRNGYSPTYREIAEHFEINLSVAKGHCEALERKGWVSRQDGIARSLVPFIIGYPKSGVRVS